MPARPVALAAVLAVAAGLAPAAVGLAPTTPPAPNERTATVTLSSQKPGTRPVMLRITLETSLQCGRAVGTETVTLPSQFQVPTSIDRTAVRYGGRAAAKVATSGHTIVVSAARDKVMCHSIAMGPETLTFAAAAKLGNPAKAGKYTVVVKRGTAVYRGIVTIGP
jgi:hypothetical protein